MFVFTRIQLYNNIYVCMYTQVQNLYNETVKLYEFDVIHSVVDWILFASISKSRSKIFFFTLCLHQSLI